MQKINWEQSIASCTQHRNKLHTSSRTGMKRKILYRTKCGKYKKNKWETKRWHGRSKK